MYSRDLISSVTSRISHSLLVGVIAFTYFDPVSAVGQSDIRCSVVKIHTTVCRPDYWRPWIRDTPYESWGSGVVIEGHRILTNAHVVQYATQIYVQGYHCPEKAPARVLAVTFQSDLAILEVENVAFFEGRAPVPLGIDVPEVKTPVTVYGFPQWGTDLSVTDGIVSRVEFGEYSRYSEGLRIQIDAALNPGNSGGPAIHDGKIVGISFGKMGEGENVGYLIPAEEVRLLLDDIADGAFEGKPELWGSIQFAENRALRAKLKLESSDTGIIVVSPLSTDESYPLKKWDLITQIGGYNIDNNGNVKLKADLQVAFPYLVPKLARNRAVQLTVIRAGQRSSIRVPVSSKSPLVITPLHNKYPSYFIYGPIVFSSASAELADRVLSIGSWISHLLRTQSPLLSRRHDFKRFEDEELVIVPCGFLPHPMTRGYTDASMQVVTAVNGISVRNLRHLVQILRDSTSEYTTFDFAGECDDTLVFERQEIRNETQGILAENGIRDQCSEDLRQDWEGGANRPEAISKPLKATRACRSYARIR